MVITLAAEAEDFAACTSHSIQLSVYLDAVPTVHSRAETVVLIVCYEGLAQLLLKFHYPRLPLLAQT